MPIWMGPRNVPEMSWFPAASTAERKPGAPAAASGCTAQSQSPAALSLAAKAFASAVTGAFNVNAPNATDSW